MRQTNIYDFIEEKDWIDDTYIVWKAFHRGEWTEYSPKFLTDDDAKEWRMSKGEYLCDSFGRKLKKFTCRPSDNNSYFYFRYKVGDFEETKCVPGDDFDDAYDNLVLFINPDDVGLGFKINV